MVFWMSGKRGEGEKVPPHAKVPRRICEKCHVQGAAEKTWQAIATTAGHRTHLESDSLKGKIECLTCHARSAHRFVPADTTCSQKGCHLSSQVQIRLGKMADQTSAHCNACHRFTKAVPLLATRDSAQGSLRPAGAQCLECHGMKLRTAKFDLTDEPHSSTCGFCHNPHEQVKPADALKSCTTAGCHDNWRKVAFHDGQGPLPRGPALRGLPRSARRPGGRQRLHRLPRQGRGQGRRYQGHPPQPFDTLQALKRTSALPPPRVIHGKGDAPPAEDLPAAQLYVAPVADTFPHQRHESLQCITCHSLSSKKSTLTFEPPRGCQICHHQAPERNDCAKCHQEGGDIHLPAGQADGDRSQASAGAPDRHLLAHRPRQGGRDCTTCHTTPVTMAPADSVVTCAACHDKHHTTSKNCAGCHRAARAGRRPCRPPEDPFRRLQRLPHHRGRGAADTNPAALPDLPQRPDRAQHHPRVHRLPSLRHPRGVAGSPDDPRGRAMTRVRRRTGLRDGGPGDCRGPARGPGLLPPPRPSGPELRLPRPDPGQHPGGFHCHQSRRQPAARPAAIRSPAPATARLLRLLPGRAPDPGRSPRGRGRRQSLPVRREGSPPPPGGAILRPGWRPQRRRGDDPRQPS